MRLYQDTMLSCDVVMIVEHGASVESFNCTFLKPLWWIQYNESKQTNEQKTTNTPAQNKIMLKN